MLSHDRCTPRLFQPTVHDNVPICDEHYRLILSCVNLDGARPGQFLHIGPATTNLHEDVHHASGPGHGSTYAPFLRRAFSIAALRQETQDVCQADVIYRVVGAATEWMASLRRDDQVSAIGPLGNAFPISTEKRHAWLVGGGVGLPPLLWLAEALRAAQRSSVAFLGARSENLLALTLVDAQDIDSSAATPSLSSTEFSAFDTPVVISTDDGSLGFRGHVGQALAAFHDASSVSDADIVVYVCGPERMMEHVARYCLDRAIECYLCMERAMACGTGTCQSCVAAVHDDLAIDRWRYALCCSEGPVFEASRVIWSHSNVSE